MTKAIYSIHAKLLEITKSVNIFEDWEIIIDNAGSQLIHLFDDVDDFRESGKVKYKLSNILLMIFLCILREKKQSALSIADDIHFFKKQYEEMGLIEDGHCPSHDTIRRVLMFLDSKSLLEMTIIRFSEYLQELEEKRTKQLQHLSFDGKEVRGSGRKETTQNPQKNFNFVNAYDNGKALCLDSVPVDSKTNEIPVVQQLLETLNLKKNVITFDALHTQRDTCSYIHQKKGFYVAPVKENQKLLLEEIKAKLNRYQNKTIHTTEGKREFEILFLPGNYSYDGFEGIKTMVKMISKTRKDKKTVMYFIANTKDTQLIIEAISDRWQIENDFHKEKDVFLNEDSIRYTNKQCVQNMVYLNNLATAFIRLFQTLMGIELREAKRYAQFTPEEMIEKTLTVMNSQEITDRLKATIKLNSKKES